jgi:cytochrome c-type biogenesis protein CcmF
LKFVPRHRDATTNEDLLSPEKAFTLYPEAELNPTMGVLAHPSRKITLGRDIYVHVATASKNEEEPKFQFYQFDMAVGDTVQTGRMKMIFERISSDSVQGTDYELIAKAHLTLYTDMRAMPVVEATPIYRIDKENRVSIEEDYIDELYTAIAFVAVNTATGKINIQVQERTNPPEDDVVIQVISKPWINLLWLGTFVLVFGFGMAMARRIRENRAGRPSKPKGETVQKDA